MSDKKNIYKWNEITYKTFFNIFKSFYSKENWTIDKILEIQDPIAISKNIIRRFYIGDGIKLDNFIDYPNPFFDLLKIIDPNNEINNINSLILINRRPIIIPLLENNRFLETYFGNSKKSTKNILGSLGNSKWYIRDSSNIIIDNNINYPDEKRLIRVRTIDINYWKKLIDSYLINNILFDCENDLKKEDIKIKE